MTILLQPSNQQVVYNQGQRISNARLSSHSAIHFIHYGEEGRETTELVIETGHLEQRQEICRIHAY